MGMIQTWWSNHGGSTWSSSGGSTVYFWIDAIYESQSIADNTTKLKVRLTTTADHQNGNGGSGYYFSCSYCGERSGGEVWYYANETILESDWQYIKHNDDGKKTITVYATATNKYLGINVNFSANIELPAIPRKATITSAQDFNDEQNPVLSYKNPAGSAVTTLQACLSFDGTTDHIKYRDISKSGSSYTFTLTSAERQVLYQNMVTEKEKPITFIVKSVLGETTYYEKLQKKITIVNASPTGSIALLETNQAVISKIGSSNAQTVIKSISEIQATLTTQGHKGATIKSFNMTCGALSSSGKSVYIFKGVSANTISYTITDSRNNVANGSVSFANFIPYILPTITESEFERVSLDGNDIKLNAKISCYTGSINDTMNTFTITYSGSNGQSGTITSYTKDSANNLIEIKDLVLSNKVAAGEVPTFTLTVKDMFSTNSASNIVILMVPSFDAGENDFQVNGILYVADTKGENKVDILATLKSTQTTANSAKTTANAAPKVFVQSAQPTATKKGDIWFKI